MNVGSAIVNGVVETAAVLADTGQAVTSAGSAVTNYFGLTDLYVPSWYSNTWGGAEEAYVEEGASGLAGYTAAWWANASANVLTLGGWSAIQGGWHWYQTGDSTAFQQGMGLFGFGLGLYAARQCQIARTGQSNAAGTLTAAERAQIQAVANQFRTTVDVVGSRAAGRGRNIDTDLPVGKGPGTRSDIDFRFDPAHPLVNELIASLQRVGNGAGNASLRHGIRPTYRPFIRFTPNQQD